MKRSAVVLIAAVIVAAVFFVSSLGIAGAAQKEQVTFEKNLRYDIWYVVSEFEVDTLQEVVITGTAYLGDREFLFVKGTRTEKTPSVMRDEGYILAETIRAILPSEMPKPERFMRTD